MIPFLKKNKDGKKPPKSTVPRTAQESIPFQRMFEDGTCRVRPGYYTRTIQYQDINYQLAQQEDKTGRVTMTEVAGSEQKMEADLVLIAAGFLGTEKYVADAFGVDLNGRTNVATAEGAYETSVKNVFAAGDVHRGQSLVVWAIREGREVAREVDESLMGYSYLEVQ